jgi:hypothetical protein
MGDRLMLKVDVIHDFFPQKLAKLVEFTLEK